VPGGGLQPPSFYRFRELYDKGGEAALQTFLDRAPLAREKMLDDMQERLA